MKHITTLIFLFITITSIAQPTGYIGMRLYGPTMTNQWYVYNSPGQTFATSKLLAEFRDSTYAKWHYPSFQITYLSSSTPTYVKPDASGILQKAPTTDIFNPANYYDKSASDSRYLQHFTESDPKFVADSNLYARKAYVLSLLNAYYTKIQSDSRYLQSFTEMDPIFSVSVAFGITSTNITNWNSAFGWGNHSSAGYATAGNTMNFSNKSGNISMWTNNLGYLIGSGTALQYFRGDGSLAAFPILGSAAAANTTDFASSSQGALAVTALQPSGNGSGLAGITKAQVGLSNADNTSDANKPISTAEQSALNGKQASITVTTTGSSGAATFAGNTLNVPNYTSVPVNISGGQNTKITGSYPNITVSDSTTTKIYNTSGRVNQSIKIWSANVAPSTSNGYSIDISSAGFTSVLSVNVIAVRNASSATTSPNVSIKTKSTTAVVVNVVEDNPSTVTILGINVLNGFPSIFANITGLTLDVTVIGY